MEQLRTEAEKRNLVYAKNINNEYNITGLIDISKNPPKIYCFCTEEIAKEILDFHAQQSKTDADKIIILENQLRVQKGIVSRLKQKYNHQENEIEPLFSLTNSNSETVIKESQP